MKHRIIIKDGKMHFIYDDKVREFLNLGKSEVNRVSNVEPINIDGTIKWNADMSIVGGPVLGPCNTREEALQREIEWLNNNKLGIK